MLFDRLKPYALLIAGPLGAYTAYHLLFVVRYVDRSTYPLLADFYSYPLVLVDLLGFLLALVASIAAMRKAPVFSSTPVSSGLPNFVLWMIVASVAALIALSIYRIVGTLSPAAVISGYAKYQFHATNGAAWMILACYGALYVLLVEMFYSGVRLSNGGSFLSALMITSISGGRGILVLFMLAFLLMLLFQRVRPRDFIFTATISAALMSCSFLLVTEMRDTRTDVQRSVQQATAKEAPTESYEEMNYNAAFITEDTLRAYQLNAIEPQPYGLHDALVRLVPRPLMPSKPISSGETLALYPDVAKRGTNITFPLKANLMMHLGPWAFWLDWVAVAAAQVIFVWGLRSRAISPSLLSFAAFFSGCAFTLVARGGLLNARLVDQIVLLLLAHLAYCVTMAMIRKHVHTAAAA